MKLARNIFFLLSLAWTAVAQTTNTFDSSGNGLLNGSFFFRNVIWIVGDNAGNLSEALLLTGTITFDGKGAYSMTCRLLDTNPNSQGCPTSAVTGTYRISASGFGYVSNPLTNGFWIGLVSDGVFIAADTDTTNDLMIAAPTGATSATNSTVNGSYWVAQMDFPSGTATTVRDAMFRVDADGAGNLGTINAKGYIGPSASAVTQSVNGARYSFSNGVGTLTYGGTLTSTNLLAGAKQMFASPDGSFIFGGSTTGFDMFVGIRASSDPKDAFSGLYYQAGATEDESSTSAANLLTFYGAFSVGGTGTVVGHQRVSSGFAGTAFDSTYSDHVSKNDDGTFSDTIGTRYGLGVGGTMIVGLGVGPAPGIVVGLQAPSFSGTGPYILPVGVENAASFAPFTTGVSRGGLISIYGTNLASTTLVDGTFPATLGGVIVLINNRPARIYVVSPTQISALVPFGTAESVAQIQVISNGTVSNVVSMLVKGSTPGVFTNPAGGVGYAAALHPDYTLVTPKNPVQVGETIALFVTGLGDVTPAISDGGVAPQDPLSKTSANVYAYIGGKQATTVYSGLAPGLIGLYQLNVTIPTGVGSGDVSLAVSDANGYNAEAILPMK